MKLFKGIVLIALVALAIFCAVVQAGHSKPDCYRCGGHGNPFFHGNKWACHCYTGHSWCEKTLRCVPVRKPKRSMTCKKSRRKGRRKGGYRKNRKHGRIHRKRK